MSVALQERFVKLLKNRKNLLAFSAGVDSSALFYLLLKEDIPFDVACVNYKSRKNSDIEANHVKKMAEQYKKKSYIFSCKLKDKNFEHEARVVRYEFFEKIITRYRYENLLLAHQLDDRFEWLMMQICKGAGASELVGFNEVEKRKNYTLIRPLHEVTKSSLKAYLDKNGLSYFEDKSNENLKYKRNFFRKNITSKLLLNYKDGIQKSLAFLQKDAQVLNGKFYFQEKELFVYKLQNDEINIRLIDKAIKKLGFVMSEKSRLEALKENAVISHKIAVGKNQTYGFISPFVRVKMDKKFKEKCRIFKIPKHIRGYMYIENINFFND